MAGIASVVRGLGKAVVTLAVNILGIFAPGSDGYHLIIGCARWPVLLTDAHVISLPSAAMDIFDVAFKVCGLAQTSR